MMQEVSTQCCWELGHRWYLKLWEVFTSAHARCVLCMSTVKPSPLTLGGIDQDRGEQHTKHERKCQTGPGGCMTGEESAGG